MSTRQIRRLRERLEAAKLKEADKKEDSDSGDDFEPLYMHSSKTFGNLVPPQNSSQHRKVQDNNLLKKTNDGFSLLMDGAGSPVASDENVEPSSDESPEPVVCQKKKKNNRKKKNKQRERQTSLSADTPESEVERAVAEVNMMLGSPVLPAAPAPLSPAEQAAARSRELLRVDGKYLDSEEELNRRFGPYEEEGKIKTYERPNIQQKLRRRIGLPSNTYSYSVNGLSLNLLETRNGVKYFKFCHATRYEMNVRGVIAAVKHQLNKLGPPEYDIYNMITMEATLQNIDLNFMMEDNTSAFNILQGSICFLQSIFCASFNYSDGKTRLEYAHVENRMFHIILLKYLYVLSNKACHRTALEIAKILLSLDPSDPLGIIFIMDTIALRAREYQWIIDIYNAWKIEREAGQIFHLMYSYALAKYGLYLKSRSAAQLAEADKALKDAMLQYPNVVVMLLAHCSRKCPEVTEHELFGALPKATTSPDLLELQQLYVALAGGKYREDDIIKWIAANAIKLKEEYDNDPAKKIKATAHEAAHRRNLLFRKHPIEIKRHLFVIRSMSELICEGAVPLVQETYSFNPYPFEGHYIDTHKYFKTGRDTDQMPDGWASFIETLLPENPEVNND